VVQGRGLERTPWVFVVTEHVYIILHLIDGPRLALQDNIFLVGHDVICRH